MPRQAYDTFLMEDPDSFPDNRQLELVIRDLTPSDRRKKYRCFYAKAQVSKSAATYPDLLWIRQGRGQLLEKPWSIKILKELNRDWTFD